MFPLSASTLCDLVAGTLVGNPTAAGERITTDSRAGVRSGDVFVGLVGPRFDGGAFAGSALAEGASIALVSSDTATPPLAPGQALVRVDHPLRALQALAAEARRRFAGTVVAITGSNGKTLVKDMIAACLSPARSTAMSPMSYNSQVGVALSLLHLDPFAEVALVECGISEVGEMARLREMVRPDVGLITNIGDAHLAGLGSREVTAREKASLFSDCPGWVLTADALARDALSALGISAAAPSWAGPVPIAGGADFLAGLAVLAADAATRLGASARDVEAGLLDWRPAPMRLEMSTTPRGVLLINDAYTADPESVDSALRLLSRERGEGHTVAVLGGMAQLGPAGSVAHAQVGARLVELGIDRLVAVGPGAAAIADAAVKAGMPERDVRLVPDVEVAATVLEAWVGAGDRVLLKGSRPDRLERLAPVFLSALSPARLTVDLDALVRNYQRVKAAVGAGVGVMAVVKAFGYGIDATRLSRALAHAGVDHFAVAYPDEGLALRDAGIATPILVQNVLEPEAAKVVYAGLSAQVSTRDQADWLASEAERQRRVVRVHVKLDTGMARAGADPDEAVPLCARVAGDPWLHLDGLMTHFAASDDPAHDADTGRQIARFRAAVDAVDAAGLRPRWVHACNSAAVARFPEAWFSMVRLGLGLLGYSRVAEVVPLGQEPVLRLVTHVVSVKRVRAGQGVGYGLTWTAPSNRVIAVVALGYSDGYPWSLSNHGWMAVHGHRCPVVGRVCMDVSLVDVTDVDRVVRAGDEVVVFGPGVDEPDLVDLAALAGTIPYELLTRLSPRVRRIFHTSR